MSECHTPEVPRGAPSMTPLLAPQIVQQLALKIECEMPEKASQDKNESSNGSKPGSTQNKPYQSTFWTKYIEKQKRLKAGGPNNDKKSNSNSTKNQPPNSKTFVPKPITIKPSKQVSALDKKDLELRKKLANTTSLLLLLLKTDRRIQGRDRNFTTVIAMKSSADPEIKKYYVICILLYQCLLGAVGGIVVGIQTRFLSPNRFPTPNTLVPPTWNLPSTRHTGELFVKSWSVGWRACKRGAIAGLLFDYVDRKVEEHRNQRDWKNTAIAGGICGSLFGLRGGLYGPLHGALSFSIIGALGGYFWINRPRDNEKYARYNNYALAKIKKRPDDKDY